MKTTSIWIAAVFAVTAAAATLCKAEDAAVGTATFARFAEVAGFEKQYHQMLTILTSNFQQGMIAGFENSIAQQDVAPDVKLQLRPIINQGAESLKRQFESLFREEIQFSELVNEVYFPVYRKHFSEQEISELIAFYQSPLGRKVTGLTPDIMRESSERFNLAYGTRIQQAGGELVKRELDSMIVKFKAIEGN